MNRSSLAAAVILALAAHAQTVLPAKSPYDRRGLYHATIRGRVVSPSGEPVPGVHVQLIAGRPSTLPLIDAVTSTDGRFTMLDVNSRYAPYLTWYPPEGWVRGEMAVVGESLDNINVGTIRLEPDTIIRVAVEPVGGPPLNRGTPAPSVTLVSNSRFGPRIGAEAIGSEFVARGITFEEGTWEVYLFNGRTTEEFTAPLHVRRGRRDQKFTLRLMRDRLTPNPIDGLQGKMEVVESVVPPTPIDREFTASGRIVGPGQSPVDGAIVTNLGIPRQQSIPRWVRSGPDGKFKLQYQAANCESPSVSYGNSDYWNTFLSEHSTGDLPCTEWLRSSPTVVMPTPSRLSLQISGVDPSQVRADWWHHSFGWQPFASLRPWVPAWGLWDARVRVTSHGYLPVTRPLEFAPFDPPKQKPPPELALQFPFDKNARRTLSVVSSGKPVSAATVDVESIVDLNSDRRVFLANYTLPTDGRLELLGGSDQLVEVFIYKEGFEPVRAIWNVGSPLIVNLSQRSSTLNFPASSAVKVVRIRNAESPLNFRTVSLSAQAPTRFPVKPGTYDITCYSASGGTTGYQRLTVAPARSVQPDCFADQRPRLTIVLPGEGWRLSISEPMPHPDATARDALFIPDDSGFRSRSATFIHHSKTEPAVAFAHAGRWHVEAWHGYATLSLWRDIDLKPGASATLTVPAKTGTLKGSMRTYGGDLQPSIHGVGAPRLQLIADDPAGWSVTEEVPERDAREGAQRHSFTLSGIPAGTYHVYQHLIGTQQAQTGAVKTKAYSLPIDAWGGIPVKVEIDSVTRLKDFSDYSFSPLHVRITDAANRPIDHATLRVRDRMSEAWRQIAENPPQLEQAADPIPYPPAARIVNGRATLPNIREGWLELLVEPDSGPTYSFTVPVSPQRELQLRLPAGN